jgi:homospermidine synthase
MKSLENFRDNGYKVLSDYQVVRRKDVISGCDSIGALLVFENGEKFIGSTICSVEDCDKFGLLSGPTCLQVAAYMMGCIRFAMKHKNYGLNNSETIPHKELFKYSEKYMGKSIFKKI